MSWKPTDKNELFRGLSIYKLLFEDGKKSKNWYYEFRHDGDRVRASTKKSNVQDAITVAQDAHYSKNEDAYHGLDRSQTFGKLAEDYLAILEDDFQNDYIIKSKYRRQKGALENYLIPYFSDFAMGKVSFHDIEDYKEWRLKTKKTITTQAQVDANLERRIEYAKEQGLTENQIGHSRHVQEAEYRSKNHSRRQPSPSTINSELTTLRAVFKLALRQRVIASVPEIQNVALRGKMKKVPAFSEAEVKELLKRANRWRKVKKLSPKTRYYRNLFYCFVRIGFQTGLRTSEELSLRFDDFSLAENRSGNLITEIVVRAELEGARKTGFRRVVASRNVSRLVTFMRSQANSEWLFPVFDEDTPIKGIKKSWASLMDYSKMEIDKSGTSRTPYSLRHSYISLMLQKQQVSIYTIAENCGNSVAVIEKHYGKGIAV